MNTGTGYNYKKGLAAMAASFIVWGFQPLYWALSEMDTMFLMLWRICMAGLMCLVILMLRGQTKQLFQAFRDPEVLKKEIPAAVLLALDWFVYLFAVRNGRTQEVSLGYYCMPIVIFFFGAVVFREKVKRSHFIVLGLIVCGILAGVRGFGEFPWVSVVLALDFAVYSALRRGNPMDSILSTSMEILLMLPFALAALLLFYRGDRGLSLMTLGDLAFVAGAGLVTCFPMLTYAVGVRNLPMFTTALCHYSSPTFTILCSLILGETLSGEKIISFLFIWAAILVYILITVRENRGTASGA